MRHDVPPPPDDPDRHGPGGSTAGAMEALVGFAADYHRLLRDGLAMFCRISTGGVTAATGLPPGVLLELDHRLPVPLVRQLETVAARLPVLPDCAAIYTADVIEFADLATIVAASSRLSGPALAELDRWAACRAADLADTGPLHLLAGDVADRAGQLRAPGWASRQERRRTETSQVRMQQDFDGGGMLYADLDARSFTTVATAVETVAGPPCPTLSRPTQRADALVRIAEHALAGTHHTTPDHDHDHGDHDHEGSHSTTGHGPDVDHHDTTGTGDHTTGGHSATGHRSAADDEHETTGDHDLDHSHSHSHSSSAGGGRSGRPTRGQPRIPRRPRTSMTVVVDLAQATSDRFGLLQTVTGLRHAPTLSARLVDTLAADATLLVQLTDGRRPLAELTADDIPDAVRRSVVARDRGCRAPGCHRPVRECDVHHLVRRTDGGPHDPDNLTLLCRGHHRDVDRHGWTLSLDATSAVLAWTHPGTRRTYRTVPHGTRPTPTRPGHVPLAPWEAPPVPPAPGDRHDPGPHPHHSQPHPDDHHDPGPDPPTPPVADADP